MTFDEWWKELKKQEDADVVIWDPPSLAKAAWEASRDESFREGYRLGLATDRDPQEVKRIEKLDQGRS